MFSISAVPCFDDNYIWVLHQNRQAIAVDPGDAAPLLAFLAAHALTLTAVLITHRHWDHVDGLPAIAERHPVPVYGPASIAGVTHPVDEGASIPLLGCAIRILATPGHTNEHLSYLTDDALFCGDTLFGAGCGRASDGNMPQLYTSLQRLAALPESTQVYCTHEYTLANLRFAAAVEPGNPAIAARMAETNVCRTASRATVPSTIGIERATNPFLRCEQPDVMASARRQAPDSHTPAEVFCALRTWKNHFK